MKGIFVTGTDTGVGKTMVTGLLARYLLEKGQSVITQKWIQTGSGSNKFSPDIARHLKLMGKGKDHINGYQDLVCPYSFRFPASPHLASRMEGRPIREDKIKAAFKELSRHFNFVLVEGLGGALVPFNKQRPAIDIAKDLRLPVLLVVQNKLGAINHTLLTIECLRKRKLKILGIVFNNIGVQPAVIVKDNPRIIKALSQEDILGLLPRENDFHAAYKKFKPIGVKILKRLL